MTNVFAHFMVMTVARSASTGILYACKRILTNRLAISLSSSLNRTFNIGTIVIGSIIGGIYGRILYCKIYSSDSRTNKSLIREDVKPRGLWDKVKWWLLDEKTKKSRLRDMHIERIHREVRQKRKDRKPKFQKLLKLFRMRTYCIDPSMAYKASNEQRGFRFIE